MLGIPTPRRCPECNEPVVFCGEWSVHKGTHNDVQNGLLRLSDVSVHFVLGCTDCSATILTVEADKVARSLTEGGFE